MSTQNASSSRRWTCSGGPNPAGALTLLFGIDPIVSLRDNGDVAPEQIPDVLGWTAATLVRAALADRR